MKPRNKCGLNKMEKHRCRHVRHETENHESPDEDGPLCAADDDKLFYFSLFPLGKCYP